jgi:uncharacterized spore protein YtfJ
MAVQELLESLSQRLGAAANVRNVYGDPIISGEKTIIPVATVAYGFGGGTGKGKAGGADDGHEGAGAGGGVKAQPAGVIEVTASGTRFIPAMQTRLLAAVALAGFALGFLYAKRGT